MSVNLRMDKKVGFVVCTHNRGKEVSELYESFKQLIELNYTLDIVDNSSDKTSFKLLERIVEKTNSELCKLHKVSPQGLSFARNFALKNIEKDYLWFLDDDVLIPNNFIETLKIIEKKNLPFAFGGKVIPKYPKTPPDWLIKSRMCQNMISCVDYGDKERNLTKTEFLVGANFCINRRDALSCGGFDEGLGRKPGNTLLSNEDTILLEKMSYDKGVQPYYFPEAEILHLIPENRMEFGWFQKRMFWQAISDIIIGREYYPTLSNLSKYFEHLPYQERNHRGILIQQDENLVEAQLGSIYTMTYLMHNADAAS